jgi:hypothetical protein
MNEPKPPALASLTLRIDAELKLAAHRALVGRATLQNTLRPVVEQALRRVLSGERTRSRAHRRRAGRDHA